MKFVIALHCVLLFATAAGFANNNWPKVIELEQGKLTVFQPQADSYSDNVLEGRAAVSWKGSSGGAPLFGAVWLSMVVDINRDERMVHVRQLRVPQVRFPEADEQKQKELAEYLERELPKWDLPLELDRLVADLDLLGEAITPGLRHDPPQILHSPEPAVLVRIEGEPKLESVTSGEGERFDRVVNTPFLMVRPEDSKSFYLSGGRNLWYVAKEPVGPWAPADSVPPKVARLAELEETAKPAEASSGQPPKIIIATEPAELIVSDCLRRAAEVGAR